MRGNPTPCTDLKFYEATEIHFPISVSVTNQQFLSVCFDSLFGVAFKSFIGDKLFN